MKTRGWPIATILRGHTVMRDFAAVGAAQGQPARFVETLVPST
jgi:dihydroorotase